jgi:hypothetical protein
MMMMARALQLATQSLIPEVPFTPQSVDTRTTSETTAISAAEGHPTQSQGYMEGSTASTQPFKESMGRIGGVGSQPTNASQSQDSYTGEDLTRDRLEEENIGGGGTRPKEVSTDLDIVYTMDGHTLSIERREIEDLMNDSRDIGDELTRRIRSSLAIRLSYNYMESEWKATPRDGFCGLHVWERLSSTLSSTDPQTPNFLALKQLIVSELLPRAQSNDWQLNNIEVPAITRTYLSRSLELINSGQQYARRVDYMPLESMQWFVQRHPSPVTLWTPEFENRQSVWLTTVQGNLGPNTIDSTQSILHSSHFAFSREHFFQIGISPVTINILIDTFINRLRSIVPQDNNLCPSDVEEGATVVFQTGNAWAVGLSTQHRKRIQRGTRLILDEKYISTHHMNSETVWSPVAGDGYCGYATLKQQMEPTAPHFLRSDPHRRREMQTFLTTLLSLLPPESPSEVLRRIHEAIIHLDGATLLPRRAWCHMDLIEHFSISYNIPLWIVGRTPLQSPRWIGQMHKVTSNPTISSNGMAYNGTDHFSTFSPDITAEQRALAHHALECALNDDDLPEGWCCVRGTRRGRTIAIDTSLSRSEAHV